MSHDALAAASPQLRTAGADLQSAAEQTRLSGFTKTWTHLLAAAATVAVAVAGDGRITPGEILQVLLITATAVLTCTVPGFWLKTAATVLGTAVNAALPFLGQRWSDLPNVNPSLVIVAVLGAVASVLLPNATSRLLDPAATTAATAPMQDAEPVAPGIALQLLIDGAPVSAVVTGPTPTVRATTPTTPDTTVPAEQDSPTVPAVPTHVADAVQRLRHQPTPTPSAQPSTAQAPTTRQPRPIRSGYTPPGSGATSVLPTQPAPGGDDTQGPPTRGYSFGGP